MLRPMLHVPRNGKVISSEVLNPIRLTLGSGSGINSRIALKTTRN